MRRLGHVRPLGRLPHFFYTGMKFDKIIDFLLLIFEWIIEIWLKYRRFRKFHKILKYFKRAKHCNRLKSLGFLENFFLSNYTLDLPEICSMFY